MTVEVNTFLFGKPAWEIDGLEGAELSAALVEEIRKKGAELNKNLGESAEALTRLMKKGWTGTGTLYDVSLFKDVSLGEAHRELVGMGLDPNMATEFDDEGNDAAVGIER